MKKLNYRLLLLSIIVSPTIYSQNFAPIGATWHYQINEAFSPATSYSKWEVISDSLILGETTRKVEHTFGSNGMVQEEFMLAYEDNGVIYKYHEISNSFTTLYDFNAIAGDSWTMKNDTCSVLVTVDSTSSITVNGTLLKVLYTNGLVRC